MTLAQMRGVSHETEPLLDPFVYDFGRSGHLCPECGIGLSTVECTNGCPRVLTCDEYMMHRSNGVK